MPSQVLITGGAGFIGTHLARLLVKGGHKVSSLDIRDPKTAVDGVHYIKGDVRNPEALAQAAQGGSAIVHLAAVVSVPLCQQDPQGTWDTNVNGTQQVLEVARKLGQKVVFASSAAVYGGMGKESVPLSENLGLLPALSFYAAQKRASEELMNLYHRYFGVAAVTFRFFNVFGQGQDPSSPYSGVISVFNAKIEKGEGLDLHGGGVQTRDFVAVADIASGLERALTLDKNLCTGEPINLGSGRTVTVKQLAHALMKVKQLTVALRETPAREGDVPHSLADISCAKTILGWTPSYTLEDALRLLG